MELHNNTNNVAVRANSDLSSTNNTTQSAAEGVKTGFLGDVKLEELLEDKKNSLPFQNHNFIPNRGGAFSMQQAVNCGEDWNKIFHGVKTFFNYLVPTNSNKFSSKNAEKTEEDIYPSKNHQASQASSNTLKNENPRRQPI